MNIGVVTMKYAQDGSSLDSYFKPTMKVHIAENIAKALAVSMVERSLTPNDPTIVKEKADLVLASFFSKMTEIELAERDEYEIKSEIVNCTKWPNGNVRLCQIQYSFVKINV